MRIVLTGAGGFLGWHTQLRLHALTDHEVVPVYRSTWSALPDAVAHADAVIHVAGANRGSDEEVEATNLALAGDVASAVRQAGRPVRVVLAGTIHAGSESVYGRAKQQVSEILDAAASATGGGFADVRLPNLFGEHARPNYNTFVATFIHATIAGTVPRISGDEVGLLHVQRAAQELIDALTGPPRALEASVTRLRVREVWELLGEFHAAYPSTGEIPDLSSDFRIDLFNAYRAALFPKHYPISLVPHDDPRGRFVETVRVHYA